MIGSVVAISMKEYEEKSELGEKLGYICAWVACFLCFSMNILDIVTIYTFRKI